MVARRDRAAQRAARRRGRTPALLAGRSARSAACWSSWSGGGCCCAGTTRAPATRRRRPAEQQTLLVQVAGADGTAAANALVGVTPTRRRRPPRSCVPSRTARRRRRLRRHAVRRDRRRCRIRRRRPQALTDLARRVAWTTAGCCTSRAWPRWSTRSGGVQAAVDRDVVTTDADGNETVVVRAGNQQLDGAAAAAYATYLAEGEPEQARLARFDDVLSAAGRRAARGPGREVVAVLAQAGRRVAHHAGLHGAGRPAPRCCEGCRGRAVAGLRRPAGQRELDTGASVTSYGWTPARRRR